MTKLSEMIERTPESIKFENMRRIDNHNETIFRKEDRNRSIFLWVIFTIFVIGIFLKRLI